jgi:sugar fermentation stimulation protein A
VEIYQYPPLQKAILLRRYKRFFADIQTDDGVLTVHNPNTGSMKSLLKEGNPVLFSDSGNAARKLRHTLELISVDGEWIVSNTIRVNRIAEAALLAGALPSIYQGRGELRREYPFLDSKFDFYLTEDSKKTFVEVKSVTYFDDKCNYFPDAVTERGKKHLLTLAKAAEQGYRAVMLYMCMAARPQFACAGHIDPQYCRTLEEVKTQGVEVVLAGCHYDEKANGVRVEDI